MRTKTSGLQYRRAHSARYYLIVAKKDVVQLHALQEFALQGIGVLAALLSQPFPTPA